MTESKPSESLFVRSILPHCKRIGPLWLKNITNIRQKFRETSHQAYEKSNEIFFKCENNSARQLNEEIHIVVNLLRKLYREIQPQSIMNIIKCWLNFPEIKSDDSCILTKGDCRGRMKRIDGGKGADKVWRLDTLIGILYHGLPLTSADSNMIYHTCQRDLCIRPQHLRFRAASVSLVLVLKALEQTGYSIKINDTHDKHQNDEFVDIAGPFGILELESLRHELVQVTQLNSHKLACSSDDIYILDQNPDLKKYYLKNSPPSSPINNASKSNEKEITKRLLTRISEKSKFKFVNTIKEENINQNFENVFPVLSDIDPPIIKVDPTNLKRKIKIIRDGMTDSGTKRQKSATMSSLEIMNKNILEIQTDELEDKELIEIMETNKETTKKAKAEMIDNWYPNVLESPYKLNNENLIRVITRSESESTLELMEKKTNSQVSICCYSQLKRTSEEGSKLDDYRTSEFLDLFHSMRHQLNTGSSLKMTPNIFSPVSEIEES